MIRKSVKLFIDTRGFLTLEASIILPVSLAFLLLLISFIQISSAEIALQSAVSETGKSISANWEPVRMLVAEAKGRIAGSTAGQWLQQALDQLNDVRGKVEEAETFVDRYEAYLPEPVVSLLHWEKRKREELQRQGTEQAEAVIDPILCKAFTPVVLHYANTRLLKPDRLLIERVRLPSLEQGGDAASAYTELVVSYRIRLPVPFLNKTITIRKKALERAWVGDE